MSRFFLGRARRGTYESGCREPTAIRGPGIPPGSRSSEFVQLADFFATVLTLAGITPPAQDVDSAGAPVSSDSKTLTPILFGTATSAGRDPNEGYLLTEEQTGPPFAASLWVGVRNTTYKVVCHTDTTDCTFYNLITDPLEETPLARPDSCGGYTSGTWTPAHEGWHYCRLMQVVNDHSILSP